jgi:hypothetical protein
MTLTSLLVENFVDMVQSSNTSATSSYSMTGGAIKRSVPSMTSSTQPRSFGNFFLLLTVFLIIILIKAFIVYIGYNYVVPRLQYSLYSTTDKRLSLEEMEANFRKITYTEAIIITIFFNTLFSS